MDHPGPPDLAAFVRGKLPELRMREVVRHLLLPCPPCAALVTTEMHQLQSPEPAPEEDYDGALDRALQKALRHEKSQRQRMAEARGLEETFAREGAKAVAAVPAGTDPLALFEALLARSWALRYDNPGEMLRFAELAMQQARSLDVRELGEARVADVQCRAWAEKGNALRVLDRHREALEALAQARALVERGTGDELLEIRVAELEASLAADRRQFADALLKLTRVYRFYRRTRNHHLAGRTLILKGLYTHYEGRIEEAIELLRQGRALLDPHRDPDLVYSAAHNELLCLVDAGRFEEARQLRIERSRELSLGGGRVSEVRLRAVIGRLDAAEGNHARAEEVFREAKREFLELGRPCHSAIAALDLATVLLHRGRWVEAKEEALEAVKVFQALKLGPESYASVIVLRECFQMRVVTPALIQELSDRLRREEHDPHPALTAPPPLRIP